MKPLRYILCALLVAAAIGLLCYRYFIENDLSTNDILRASIIILGAIFSLFKKRTPVVSNKKALYQKAYGEFIQDAFSDDPKLEKKFYSAVHDYNRSKPAAGLAKLEALKEECQHTKDRYAVTSFIALCLDDMEQYEKAAAQYDAAARIRSNSTLYSNRGLCLQRLGQFDAAQDSYLQAIACDPKNAYPYNNLSALYFREDDYESALEYAQQAIALNPTMRQALSTAAMCCAMLGNQAEYEKYYRQAVANGADGNAIKRIIKQLDPTL